jgi:hypothetical protein
MNRSSRRTRHDRNDEEPTFYDVEAAGILPAASTQSTIN